MTFRIIHSAASKELVGDTYQEAIDVFTKVFSDRLLRKEATNLYREAAIANELIPTDTWKDLSDLAIAFNVGAWFLSAAVLEVLYVLDLDKNLSSAESLFFDTYMGSLIDCIPVPTGPSGRCIDGNWDPEQVIHRGDREWRVYKVFEFSKVMKRDYGMPSFTPDIVGLCAICDAIIDTEVAPKLARTFEHCRLIAASLDGLTGGEKEKIEEHKRMDDYCLETVAKSTTKKVLNAAHSPGSNSSNANTRQQSLLEAQELLQGMIGLASVKKSVVQFESLMKVQQVRAAKGLPVLPQSMHFVFTGNPGTGKTTVARILAKILYGHGILNSPKLIETDRSGLVAGYVGQTAIKTTEVVDSAIDGVLFIDEAYSLRKERDDGYDFGSEAVDTLLKRMEDDRSRLVVVVAGYPEKMKNFLRSNPGLTSRFTRFIQFDDYSAAELCQIFERMAVDQKFKLTSQCQARLSVLIHHLWSSRSSDFGNARSIRNLFEAMVNQHAHRCTQSNDMSETALTTFTEDDISYDSTTKELGDVPYECLRWEMACPKCDRQAKGRLGHLSKQVKCPCGETFTFNWFRLTAECRQDLPLR
jgi:hypothetical protein